MIVHLRMHRLAAAAALSLGLLVPASLATAQVSTRPTGSRPAVSTPIAFGPTTIVDDQRLAGEPDIKICGADATWSYGSCGTNNPFISVPWGFSTTSSFIWRSEDQGHTYKLVPSNVQTGKPTQCPGGGDTDLGVFPGKTINNDRVNFEDLQGLTNFSVGISNDGGTTFTCNPVNAFATAVDRQWFGFYKNPASTGSAVYLDYDIADGGNVSPTCLTSTDAGGNLFVVQKSTNGGLTYSPFTAVDCNDGIAGNMQVNQKTGHVFAIHTAYAKPATCSNSTDAVVVNKSVDGGTTWTKTVVYQPGTLTATCGGDVTVGQDFAVLAIDRAGGLYAVWSQAPVDTSGNIAGPSHIFMSYSSDDGKTWTHERRVDTGTTNVDLFPWITAGDPGRIDVVWYGTSAKSPTKGPWDPGSQTSDWYPYLSQSLNANTASASFSAPVRVAQHPNHNGGICTMGIGCTTGGDRSLADFFQVDLNAAGAAEVVWADSSNNSGNNGNQGALITTATQTTGASLLAGHTLSGKPRKLCTTLGVQCQRDGIGDARYEANGTIGADVPNLDLTNSTVAVDKKNQADLSVRMGVQSLKALPASGEAGLNSQDPVVDYLTSWVYHNPKGTQATYDSTGNEYFAYFEVNTLTGATTAMAGNTCSLSTTHGKYLVYPGSKTVASSVDKKNNRITLHVPRSLVGNPPDGAVLYSVTAHTVGQKAAAAGAGGAPTCTRDPNGNNQDTSGQIFDVYDKSPAYTAQLTAPLVIHGHGVQSGKTVTFKWHVLSGTSPLGFDVLGETQQHNLVKLNSAEIRANATRSYTFAAHGVKGDIDFFTLQLHLASKTIRYGRFIVSG